MGFRNISFWYDTVQAPNVPAPANAFPSEIDVAIIGGGFTGLWTAYYLCREMPSRTIAVFEAERLGFGASGRNGGWCTSNLWGIEGLLNHADTRSSGIALHRAMCQAVDEIERVCDAEGIACDFHRGGSLMVANTTIEVDELRRSVDLLNEIDGAASYQYLDEDRARERFCVEGNLGARYDPRAATLNPLKLIYGLAARLRDGGVHLCENTPVEAFGPGGLSIRGQRVKAGSVIRATEGYTGALKGPGLRIQPLYSMMLATEPLPGSLWAEIGLSQRESFGDSRSLYIYGQRTADDRLVFGGRAGYLFGAKRVPIIRADNPGISRIESSLREMLPQLDAVQLTHGWGGLMGVHQNWRPSVSFDRGSGIGSAGGYVGNGLATSNLAARTLCDLILDRQGPITSLPWVTRDGGLWEP